ncbi:hypothetical protein MNBD_NITROSPINAE02-2097 [hydrothermal vent metagenome]|uniref:Uncharacterized protein n=1 Tax=hydrothermal vent metagenome TaxID=652676 RepID=A0A3B1CFL3_9ZZZZ
MRDFNQRLAAAFALMGAGVAGFVSMYAGALIAAALTRALIAGIVLYILGRLIASALYLGPQPPVEFRPPSQHKENKE